jgi:phosphoenolpyruvate carboxykinase (GTP)
MLPFTGYHMGDYFQHWLDMGEKLSALGAKLPGIFTTNWFRKGANGEYVWPGYGENMRVLKWIIDRIDQKITGKEHFYGVSPAFEELHWAGLNFSQEQFDVICDMDKAAWMEELALHDELFEQLSQRLPQALRDTRQSIQEKLAA